MGETGQTDRVMAAVAAAAALAVAGVLVVGLGSGGCFSPKFESCAVSCGEASACPDDQFCLSDGKCHASQDDELCTSGGDASVDDGDDVSDVSDDPDDTSDVSDVSDDPDDTSDDPDDSADDVVPPDGGPPDASLPDAGPAVTPTEQGDLVISEIHKDPFESGDLTGEWFEVYNPTKQTFDMQGLRIGDFGAESFDIVSEVIVPPGGRVIFARRGDPDVNGGVTGVDYVWGDAMSLGNNGDEILIENVETSTFIDAVLYDLVFPDIEGAAMSLDPDLHDTVDNDSSKSWCAASTVYGAGDLGTPGTANPDC